MAVDVYRSGLCYCSVCASKEMPLAQVIAETNAENPTGMDHGWELSPEKFKTGDPNPCKCNTDDSRLHYLMVC